MEADKEEQRLLRSMNNRVNQAINNKPKANFTFSSNTSTPTRAASSTFGAYNKIIPVVIDNTKVEIQNTNEDKAEKIDVPALEIVKSSNPTYDNDLKNMFADDHARSIKMEEDRLSRTLGKRSDRKQVTLFY